MELARTGSPSGNAPGWYLIPADTPENDAAWASAVAEANGAERTIRSPAEPTRPALDEEDE